MPSDTEECFDALIRSVDVGGIEAIVVWITIEIGHIFIEWVIGA